jgi:predicted alpha/beta superfamily hydrolase
MKCFATPLLVVSAAWFAFALPLSSRADVPVFPPHVIPNSALRALPTNAHGRTYQLHVGLPGSYRENPTRRYPVVFVTDAYWDFQKIDAIRGSLVYDKLVPEFIVVGLGYVGENLDYGSLRTWELSPVAFGSGSEAVASSGHAAEFLQTIEREIIPFIEREYRADPTHRVLAGASLGGLFTLYAMYTKPELFTGYIAASPAVVVGDDWLLGYADKFAASQRALPVRLFVSGGGDEWPDFLAGVKRFDEHLRAHRPATLAYQFRIIDGARHSGMQFESYVRGLTFVFATDEGRHSVAATTRHGADGAAPSSR